MCPVTWWWNCAEAIVESDLDPAAGNIDRAFYAQARDPPMIVKTQQFKLPSLFLFNAAASLLFLGAGGYVVRDMLFVESVPQCSERYAETMLFALQRPSGETLTAADLQSRLSGRDWGLLLPPPQLER